MNRRFGAPGRRLGAAFAAILVLDQITKALAERWLSPYEPVSLVPGCLQLILVHNTGVAFGLLNGVEFAGKAWLLTGLSAGLLLFIVWFAARSGPLSPLTGYGITGMVGGAVGNIVDRLTRGQVVDFVDAYLGSAHWPTFNVADAAICCGAGLLLFDSVREFRRAAGASAPAAAGTSGASGAPSPGRSP